MINTRSNLTALVLLFCVPALFSQTSTQVTNQIEAGKLFFQNGRYQEALASFRESLTDPRLSNLRAEASFWTAKTLYSLSRWDEASRSFDAFLAQYPSDRNAVEAEYLRSRIYYLVEDYESAIQLFARFIQRYPTSPFVPNAYYWTAESFYSQGNLAEAKQVYQLIVNNYESSSRFEAAQYRLEVLDLKQKEQELIQLLRWTQEESIKLTQEFRRQEQAYQQAIQSLRSSSPSTAAENQSAQLATASELRQAQARVESLLAQNRELSGQLQAIQSSLDSANRRIEELGRSSATTPAGTVSTTTALLLEMKADVLEAKELLIQTLLEALQ